MGKTVYSSHMIDNYNVQGLALQLKLVVTSLANSLRHCNCKITVLVELN